MIPFVNVNAFFGYSHMITHTHFIMRFVIVINNLVIFENAFQFLDTASQKRLGITRCFQFSVIDKISILPIFMRPMQPFGNFFTPNGF